MADVDFQDYWSNGEHYRGYCLRGQLIPHGWGVKEYPGKWKLEGNFRNGYLHGWGTASIDPTYLVFSSNLLIRYEGFFSDGYYHGYGTATYYVPSSGAISNDEFPYQYSGEWWTGAKHGYGEMRYFSGARYIGRWQADRQNGRGLIIYGDGCSSYDGEWKDGKKEGYGVFVSKDGRGQGAVWHKDTVSVSYT
jgi:hypothetical protein